MQTRHYRAIIYFISIVILLTLAMQVFWNYKNYQAGKQQLINEVQICLDNAIDTYYTNLAEESMIGFTISERVKGVNSDSITLLLQEFAGKSEDLFIDELEINLEENCCDTENVAVFTNQKGAEFDTLFTKIKLGKNKRRELISMHLNKDSLSGSSLAKLTTKVIFAASKDTLNLSVVKELVSNELNRKKIAIDFFLKYTSEYGTVVNTEKNTKTETLIKTRAKSNFIGRKKSLDLYFNNVSSTILYKNSIGFLLSFLFSIAIIATLLYLLKSIRNQKQLAEIKNDLISNITHEFKTPLATIGAAMEGIQHFNTINDEDKTQRYAKVSATQVDKLTIMVEKMLETATLDSEKLELNKEEINVTALLKTLTTREYIALSGKTVQFESTEQQYQYKLDKFHFENALNNLIDNAIKYGGDIITVSLTRKNKEGIITVKDNGNELTHSQSKQIFEKFYRVPKGNTHDIKGFGIGLYYTKTIVEKHGGTSTVQVNPTSFKITLP